MFLNHSYCRNFFLKKRIQNHSSSFRKNNLMLVQDSSHNNLQPKYILTGNQLIQNETHKRHHSSIFRCHKLELRVWMKHSRLHSKCILNHKRKSSNYSVDFDDSVDFVVDFSIRFVGFAIDFSIMFVGYSIDFVDFATDFLGLLPNSILHQNQLIPIDFRSHRNRMWSWQLQQQKEGLLICLLSFEQ